MASLVKKNTLQRELKNMIDKKVILAERMNNNKSYRLSRRVAL